MTVATLLIGLGLAFAILGLSGIFWCIRLARRVQAGKIPEDRLQGVFSRLAVVNMASVGGATLGLAMVLVGLLFR